MTDYKFLISEALLKKRAFTKSTMSTYVSLLKSLYLKAHENVDNIDLTWFNKTEEVIPILDQMPAKSAATTLSPLSVLTEKDEYKKKMFEITTELNKDIKNNVKTEKQAENWIDWKKFKKAFSEMEKKIKPELTKKRTEAPTVDEIQEIQNYVIMGVACGLMDMAPRRLMDWTPMFIRGEPADKVNYYKDGEFHFWNYKTASKYGEQIIPASKKVKALISKWMKINKSDSLFITTTGDKMTKVVLHQRINGIINKMIGIKAAGINGVRHAYITYMYKDTPTKQDAIDTAAAMAHSPTQQQEYRKK